MLSVVAGIMSGVIYIKGIPLLSDAMPIVFYLATFIFMYNQSYKTALGTKKLIYHGIGTYIISWLVIYMLSITLITTI
ncbi:MAG: hypothetical protein ACP5NC_03985 [Nitrososphaeria archaeon]